jgi:SulP family sulfate permease
LEQWWNRYQGDVVGGITVAIVALPLALAFGIASGAGAAAGLYAAIFAGFVTSLFGGSEVQVSGPTGAMTVVLVSLIRDYGIQGMCLAGAMAGLMQLALGAVGLGRLVKYLPQPVISGFTNGIAIIIFASQLDSAFGSPVTAVVTIVAIVLASLFAKRIPSSLLGLAAGILVNELFVHTTHVVGPIPTTLPRPSLALLPLANMANLLMPAFTICLLGSIEALLSAEVGDAMTGQQHDSNRELIGQGLGNLVSALVGGVPVTGAIARTAVNAKSGGRTRLSGMIHAVILLLTMLLFGQWAQEIPLGALSAILMVTAVDMVDWRSFSHIPRTRWSYTATLLITMLLTVVQDLTVGVAVGVAVAVLFVIVELTKLPMIVPPESHHVQALPSVPPRVNVTSLTGPLLFLTVRGLTDELDELPKDHVQVVDFSQVSTIDESAALALRDQLEKLQERDVRIYLGGLQRAPLRALIRLGLLETLERRRVCKSLSVALARASEEAAQMREAA